MSALTDIQRALATARLERARLRHLLREAEANIGRLEAQQTEQEDAIAVVGTGSGRSPGERSSGAIGEAAVAAALSR